MHLTLSRAFCYVGLLLVTRTVSCQLQRSITVAVTPQRAAVGAGQITQFTATVTGGESSVNWSVDGIPSGNSTVGTIDSDGRYTAPSGASSIAVITATSREDTNKSASAQALVVAPGTVTATNNPQVAQFTISPPAAANVSVQFGLDTGYGLTTWTQPTPSNGGAVNLFVAGMRANLTYHMRGVVQFSDGMQFLDEDQVFTTGILKIGGLPTFTATTSPGMTPQPGVELVNLVSVGNGAAQTSVVATDLAGNIIWGFGSPLTGVQVNPVKLLSNGHVLINISSALTDGANSVLQEVDLAGNLIWQLTAAQLNEELAAAACSGCNITVVGTHHDFASLPNGHLIVIAATQRVLSGTTVTGDVIIDLDQNRQPVWLWNEFDHLDTNRRPYLFPDWTHTNAVLYSKDDGNLIISIRHQNWLVKIDYANGTGTGDILWRLGYQGDFTLAGGTEPTDWFYAQHGPSFVTTNTTGQFSMAIFDNGDDRIFPAGVTCGASGQPACLYSTTPIFNLDETAKTATLTFHAPAPFYSFFGGNNEVLGNGNVEYDIAATTALPANNAAIFEVTMTSPPQNVWQLQITGQYAYRGIRIASLYPGVQW